MANAWMNHVRNFRQRNSKLSYREVLKQARRTYGGGVEGNTRSIVAKNAGIVGGGIEGDMRSTVAKHAGIVGGGIEGDMRTTVAKYASVVGGRRKTKGKRSGTRRRRR
jgi:hypothetical protein